MQQNIQQPKPTEKHREFICTQHIEEETEEENDNGNETILPIQDEQGGKKRNGENNHPTEAESGEQTTDTQKREEREGKAQKEEEAKRNTRQQRKPQTKCKKHKIDETEMTDGYMNSYGKPRQPKETQMNQEKTLLYDKITETWQCLKCEKKYPKQNARSAKGHAIAHKKKEDKERTEKEITLTRI